MVFLCQTRQIQRVFPLFVVDLTVVVVVLTAVVVVLVVATAVVILPTSRVRCVSNLVTLLLFAITAMISIINQTCPLFFMILSVQVILRPLPLKLQITTPVIHKIVTVLAKTLVILDLLMFGLIPITNLSVTILSPIIVLFTNTQPQSNSTNWILDSGASFYVTGESQNIQQLEPFEGPNQIFIGNGQGLQIHSSLENWHSTMQLEYEALIKNHT